MALIHFELTIHAKADDCLSLCSDHSEANGSGLGFVNCVGVTYGFKIYCGLHLTGLMSLRSTGNVAIQLNHYLLYLFAVMHDREARSRMHVRYGAL